MNIGLLGYGKVGRQFADTLERSSLLKRKIQLLKIGVRNKNKIWGGNISDDIFTENLADIVTDPDIDTIVELIGGIEPARSLITLALKNGKHVITANRPLMAKYGKELFELAHVRRVYLKFEGAVGCGIPIINALEMLQANSIKRIVGVINGTCNYILGCMDEKKIELNDALINARNRNLTEADVLDDLTGVDAAEKLIILSLVAFKQKINLDTVFRRGILSVNQHDIENAKSLGCTIKYLAIATYENKSLSLCVEPFFMHNSHPLAAANGVVNAIYLMADPVGYLSFSGKGVSPAAVASAIFTDITAIDNSIYDTSRYEAAKDKETTQDTYSKKKFYVRIFLENKEKMSIDCPKVVLKQDDNEIAFITMEAYSNVEIQNLIKAEIGSIIPIYEDDNFPFAIMEGDQNGFERVGTNL